MLFVKDARSVSSSEENGNVLLEGAKESKQAEDSSTTDRFLHFEQ
jgi:hypothetical protein